MFPVANVPHVFHKYVLYNAKIVDKQEKNDKNEGYNYICYNVYLHYQNVVNKNVVTLLGDIAAYCYFPKKPSIRVQTVDMSNDRQLTLF